jgi:membrane associated rhomboid family serine protease
MIPIRDTLRSVHFPVVNFIIIGINVVVFFWELSQGPRLPRIFTLYGIVPLRYSDPAVASHFTALQQLLPFLTSQFLHGGIFHILGNMWFLHVFGDNIEDRIGHLRYLFFYLFCGIAAGLIHLFTNWGAKVPTIGASGAIAGIMGAYLLLFPRAKILTLIPIFFFFEIPAFVFLGYWFLIQVLSAGAASGHMGGIAFWAHIGGFVAGAVLIKLFDTIPKVGLDGGLHRYTGRQRSPRIHYLSPCPMPDGFDLCGQIRVTPREAATGTRKLTAIPQGLRKRTILITVPPGVTEGTRLRLRGLGRRDPDGHRGDLYLEVKIAGEGPPR